jgi:1-acyl-sn-glycerol-3-phosphate acyltransferase
MRAPFFYLAGRVLVDLYSRFALTRDIVWHETWPMGPKVIAANHPTTTDPFYLLAAVPEQMSILVTEMAFEVPIFGDYLRAAEQIRVSSGNGRHTVEEAVKQLERGRTIGIFPEGALSPLADGPGVHRAHTGVARLALRARVPIVPVGIYIDPARIQYTEVSAGSMSETARWYLNGPYAITVGKPIHLTGEIDDREYVRSAAQYVMQQIAHLARQSDQRIRQGTLNVRPGMRLLGQRGAAKQI